MFTGLVETTGTVIEVVPTAATSMARLGIRPNAPGSYETAFGDSIAVNGCCLTVCTYKPEGLAFDVSRETLSLTNLGHLKVGHRVNLERSLRLGDRLGGHLVSGHIDGLGTVTNVAVANDGWTITARVPQALGKYLISKGSICLDGVSLTVNSVRDEGAETSFSLMLIPTTLATTTFGALKPTQVLNVEIDMFAKYAERLQAAAPSAK